MTGVITHLEKNQLFTEMAMEQLFKSIAEQERAPIVMCDTESNIVYMNPAAIARYKRNLTGTNIKACHSEEANQKIDLVIEWFRKNKENNIVYTFHNSKENKDVYMVALRDRTGEFIGYYEKHEYRNRETAKPYDI